MADERRLTIEFVGDFSNIDSKLNAIEERAAKGVRVRGTGGGSGSESQGGIINDSPTASGDGKLREQDRLNDRYAIRSENRAVSDLQRSGSAADRGYDQYLRESQRAAEREAKANQRAADAAERRARRLEDISEGRADRIVTGNLNQQNSNEARYLRNKDAADFAAFRELEGVRPRSRASQRTPDDQLARSADAYDWQLGRSGSPGRTRLAGPIRMMGLGGPEDSEIEGLRGDVVGSIGDSGTYGGGLSGANSRSSASASKSGSSFSVGRTIKDTASLILRRLAVGAIVGGVLEVGNQVARNTEDALDSEYSSNAENDARVRSSARSRRGSLIGYADMAVSYWGGKAAFIGEAGQALGLDQAGRSEALDQAAQTERWQDRGIANRTQSQVENLQIAGVESTGDVYKQRVLAADARLIQSKASNLAQFKADNGDNNPQAVQMRLAVDARADRAHTAEVSVAERVIRASTNSLYSESKFARDSLNLDPMAAYNKLRNDDKSSEEQEKNPLVLEALKIRNRDTEASTYKGIVRDFDTQHLTDQAGIEAAKQALSGNTFESQRISIADRLAATLNSIGNSNDPNIQRRRSDATSLAGEETSLAKRANDIQRYGVSQSLYNQANVTYLDAQNKGISARALDIEQDAQTQAEIIRQQGGPDAGRNSENALRIGLNQEISFKRNLELQTYYGARSAQDYGAGGIGSGNNNGDRFSQPIVDGLKDVQKAIEDLNAVIGRDF